MTTLPVNYASLLAALVLTSLLLAGCATTGENGDYTASWSAEDFYANAKRQLDNGDYQQAIEYFEKLEARYPFGPHAQQAQIETAYAYYKYNEPDSAIGAADRFIKLHPRHPNVDYAYYLRGLASMGKNDNPLDRVAPQDPAIRDAGAMRESFQYFAELVRLFPDSRYTPDAIKRMTVLKNALARHEVHIAEYYLQRGAHLAAVNRAKYVVENFQLSTAIPDALRIMIQGYRKLNMHDLAEDASRIMLLNFPSERQPAIENNPNI